MGQTFDIGADTGTPVDDGDYHVPFRFTSRIAKLTITLEPPNFTPEDQKRPMEASRSAADAK